MLMDVEDGGEGAVPTPLMLRRSWHNGFFQPPGNYANLNRAFLESHQSMTLLTSLYTKLLTRGLQVAFKGV